MIIELAQNERKSMRCKTVINGYCYSMGSAMCEQKQDKERQSDCAEKNESKLMQQWFVTKCDNPLWQN